MDHSAITIRGCLAARTRIPKWSQDESKMYYRLCDSGMRRTDILSNASLQEEWTGKKKKIFAPTKKWSIAFLEIGKATHEYPTNYGGNQPRQRYIATDRWSLQMPQKERKSENTNDGRYTIQGNRNVSHPRARQKNKKKKRKRNVLPKHLERLVVMRYLSNHKTKA